MCGDPSEDPWGGGLITLQRGARSSLRPDTVQDTALISLFSVAAFANDTGAAAILVDEFDVRSSQSIFEKLRELKLILGAI